jgi:hypothetical protein
MSKEVVSFIEYLQNYNTKATHKFRNVFGDRINNIKNTSKSSKRIMNDLYITGRLEFVTFRETYMDFFRRKFNF